MKLRGKYTTINKSHKEDMDILSGKRLDSDEYIGSREFFVKISADTMKAYQNQGYQLSKLEQKLKIAIDTMEFVILAEKNNTELCEILNEALGMINSIEVTHDIKELEINK